MKILHICAIGITAKNLLKPQIDYLLSQNASVEVACAPGAEVDELRKQGYVIHTIPIERQITSISNLTSIYELMRLIQEKQYDFVHVHTPIAAVLGRIAAKLAGAKSIVYTAHGFPFHDRSSKIEHFIYSSIERVCARFTDLVLTQNYEDLVTSYKLEICPLGKAAYLGNGVDVEQFNRHRLDPNHQARLRQSLGIPDSANAIIGTVGRLTYKKGSSYLIEAVAKLLPRFSNFHVLVVGGQLNSDPEPFQAQLIDRIRVLGLEKHVTLTGYRDDIPELLGLMDIFTLPTFTHEGLPRSILEAMAMELPVVATDIRGCREAIVSEETGLIVPPQDSDKLAAALGTLLADAELRQVYGRAGRRRLEAEYDEYLVFKRLMDFYRALQQSTSAESPDRSSTNSVGRISYSKNRVEAFEK
jgi:glycosyltransferase involved in cell wall biosynthesis